MRLASDTLRCRGRDGKSYKRSSAKQVWHHTRATLNFSQIPHELDAAGTGGAVSSVSAAGVGLMIS